MKKNTKIFLLFIFFLNLFLITTHPAKAGCPICILGAVSIFGVSWWLKIDQLLLGFYLGGLSIFSLIAILCWLEFIKMVAKKITNPLIILSGLIIFLIFLLAIYWLSIKVICGS